MEIFHEGFAFRVGFELLRLNPQPTRNPERETRNESHDNIMRFLVLQSPSALHSPDDS